jgi:hypothetical protein
MYTGPRNVEAARYAENERCHPVSDVSVMSLFILPLSAARPAMSVRP